MDACNASPSARTKRSDSCVHGVDDMSELVPTLRISRGKETKAVGMSAHVCRLRLARDEPHVADEECAQDEEERADQ